MKVEVAISNEPTVSVDVKQHFNGGSRRGRLPDGWGRWGWGEARGSVGVGGGLLVGRCLCVKLHC